MSKPAALILLNLAMVSACGCTQRRADDRPFVDPVTLFSRDGKLHIDLVAASAVYTIEGHRFQGMLYNGRYMPPLWRVHAGDIVGYWKLLIDERDATCLETDVIGRSNTTDRKKPLCLQKINLRIQSTE